MRPQTEDISDHLARFFQEGRVPGVVSVYLFGSHASARAHRESDVDIGILLRWDVYRTRRNRFEQRLRLSGELASVLDSNEVDVVILNDAPPLLGRRIMTAGTRVFCADREQDHVCLRSVLSRAADLEPFIRHARRRKLAAMAR